MEATCHARWANSPSCDVGSMAVLLHRPFEVPAPRTWPPVLPGAFSQPAAIRLVQVLRSFIHHDRPADAGNSFYWLLANASRFPFRFDDQRICRLRLWGWPMWLAAYPSTPSRDEGPLLALPLAHTLSCAGPPGKGRCHDLPSVPWLVTPTGDVAAVFKGSLDSPCLRPRGVRRCHAFAICSIGSDPKMLPEPPLQLACRSTARLS